MCLIDYIKDMPAFLKKQEKNVKLCNLLKISKLKAQKKPPHFIIFFKNLRGQKYPVQQIKLKIDFNYFCFLLC
jgi:hypothetical protein